MSSIDLVTAVGRLLSSPELRELFERSPADVANDLNVDSHDVAAFIQLDAGNIKQQAEILLNKRWHEVRRLIPDTIDQLGEEARDTFRFFATNDWPSGHRRHTVDAHRFLQFLETNGITFPSRKEISRMKKLANSN